MNAAKNLIAITALLWSLGAGASPALLGIEPGITTVGELRQKYGDAELLAHKTSEFGGPIYRVDGQLTGAEDVIEARYIFNRNGVPVAMTGVFNEAKFEHINLMLGMKYTMVKYSNRPLASHGQQRFAWYKDGDLLISLTQPQDSNLVYLTYADQRTRNLISASLKPDEKQDTRKIWDY